MIDDLMKHYGEHKDIFYDRLESALRTARNEALEEAKNAVIKVKAPEVKSGGDDFDYGWEMACHFAAEDISALKHKDGQP